MDTRERRINRRGVLKRGEMVSEFEYLLASPDLVGENIDKWVAVVGKQIVAVGSSAKEVLEAAMKAFPGKEPFIAKFPRETALLL